MVMGATDPVRARYSGKAAAVRTSSSSSSSDNVALPTRIVSGGATRCVGRVSNDDFETSSYEETSDSSFSDNSGEEFVPLAFGYINGNPRRRAGAPARTQDPTGASEEVGSQSSFSDAGPLEVFFERTNAKRTYGKGARNVEEDEITTSLSSFDDDTSTTSDALPVEFERKKRTRGVGMVHSPTYEVSDSESTISLDDEDEAPLNAQLIYTLVKRLRNPFDEVTPEAFDYVNFNDENFKEVLEPLKQIKVCLERRASYPMKQNAEIEKKIEAAVQSLPSQKAIAAKVLSVKSRQLRPAQPTSRLYRGSESGPQNTENLPKLVARLQDPKDEVPLSEFEKIDWTDPNFEPVLLPLRQIRAYMEAKQVVKAKPIEGAMKRSTALDDKIKIAVLSLPADKEMETKVNSLASRPMTQNMGNGEAIRELIMRLKDPEQRVPVSAFQKLDWNDRQFSSELKPLMQIRAFLEAKECTQKKAGEAVMGGDTRALDDRIRTATLCLPAQKEMAAKVQAVKNRQLKAADGRNGTRLGGESSPATADKAKSAVASAPPESPKVPTVRAVRSRPISRGVTNGEEILNLIKRLKDTETKVPLCAFDELEWNDRNFARELEPLQQIRMYMEAREALKKVPGEKSMSSVPELDNKIKTAILSLPPEKAVAVKMQMLRARDMAPVADEAKPQKEKVGKLSAPAGTVRRMKDTSLAAGQATKKKSKEGKLSASTSQVMQVGARAISSHHHQYKAKESNALSEPTKKMRRPRNTANRSVSFLKVEDPTPEEIEDQDEALAEVSKPQRQQGKARPSPMTAAPRGTAEAQSRLTKRAGRRPRNRRPGNNAVSFSDLHEEEAGVINEDDGDLTATTKRKSQRRRAAHKPGRSLSISSLPDMEAGELKEEPVLPDKPRAREAATTAAAKSLAKPSGSKMKKRRVRVNNNNRSCSFSDVAMDEAAEMPDANAGALKGAVGEPAVARTGRGMDAAPPKMTRKLVRRRKLGEEGGTPALERNGARTEKEGESEAKPPSRGKGRRANVHRSRSANTSMIIDEAGGEIVELLDETQTLYSSSGKPTPAPEKVSIMPVGDRELPATARAPKAKQKLSETASAQRKRRQRLHASKELSISAIPEDAPGEIVEDERDTLVDTATPESVVSTMRRSLPPSGGDRTFPAVVGGSGRGSMRYGDRPNSSVRSSVAGSIKVGVPPSAEPSFMPDVADVSRLPPPRSLRRSAEPTPRTTTPSVKNTNSGAHIPALHASR
ncbi:hypothetical protein ABB37_09829 [Leptomonas pyrrhocoris]|uniref:Uncharacterized protein n=1 Tax=Leptomonas pyrrhocoris TaxID=157538 RepID=A0A0M9FPZ9_LEPPY|nr:hypothetical protein ABB37_09829 [Leptomonas pyrrhocoris]KPA73516.1 hypothetical protein ABB37_09829 [Leptomonas pyrrhocoris]|eukprot:XP_015651955.1 hypothetical protein ABB37_09829 [Leptomonas pyrrhocoris]